MYDVFVNGFEQVSRKRFIAVSLIGHAIAATREEADAASTCLRHCSPIRVADAVVARGVEAHTAGAVLREHTRAKCRTLGSTRMITAGSRLSHCTERKQNSNEHHYEAHPSLQARFHVFMPRNR
jgi:hypothetical protein